MKTKKEKAMEIGRMVLERDGVISVATLEVELKNAGIKSYAAQHLKDFALRYELVSTHNPNQPYEYRSQIPLSAPLWARKSWKQTGAQL